MSTPSVLTAAARSAASLSARSRSAGNDSARNSTTPSSLAAFPQHRVEPVKALRSCQISFLSYLSTSGLVAQVQPSGLAERQVQNHLQGRPADSM